jgi:hypothetical protein
VANNVKVVISGVDEFTRTFETFQHGIDSMREKMMSFLEVVGAGAAFEFVNKISESIDEMGKLSQKTGVAVEDLSSLAFAAQMNDVPMETLAKGLERISKALVGADLSAQGQSASKAIAQLGVNTKDASGKLLPLTDILGQLADKFKNEIPANERAGYALTIFGKAGAELVPVLMRGSEGLAELEAKAHSLGKALTQEDVAAAEQFRESLKLLQAGVSGLEVQFVEGLLPALNSTISAFTQGGAKISAFRSIGEFLGEGVKTVALTFADLAYSADLAVLKLEKYAKAAAHPLQTSISVAAGLAIDPQSDAQVAELDKQFTKLWNDISNPPKAVLHGAMEAVGVQAKQTGEVVNEVSQKFEKLFEAIAYEGDVTLSVLNKVRGHRDDITLLDKDLASLNARIQALQTFLAEHPGELFPQITQQLIDLKAQADATKKAIEDAAKPPDFKGQLPGGIGIGDIPINDPSKTGESRKTGQADARDPRPVAEAGNRRWRPDQAGRALWAFVEGRHQDAAHRHRHGDHPVRDPEIHGRFREWWRLGYRQRRRDLRLDHHWHLREEGGGGPVSGSTPYLVGEVGPELFVPSTSGTIIPNSAMRNSGGGGLETMRVELVVTSDTDLKIQKATARMRDQAIAASVALVRERQLRSI